jgi:hypothetical protein
MMRKKLNIVDLLGSGVGFGVGLGVGLGVGFGVGSGVGLGVGGLMKELIFSVECGAVRQQINLHWCWRLWCWIGTIKRSEILETIFMCFFIFAIVYVGFGVGGTGVGLGVLKKKKNALFYRHKNACEKQKFTALVLVSVFYNKREYLNDINNSESLFRSCTPTTTYGCGVGFGVLKNKINIVILTTIYLNFEKKTYGFGVGFGVLYKRLSEGFLK